MKNIVLFVLVIQIYGCVPTKSVDVMAETKAAGPKVIAISGTRAPWVYEIEKRLKKTGFQIKRMTSQSITIKQTSVTESEAYKEASARFVLHLDGHAPNSSMTRCFGGGYRFAHINVELIDVTNNETVFHYSNTGYSENCPPLSGTIFTDIVELTNSVWQ